MKIDAKLITVAAVTFALTAVLGLLPYVFFIPLLFTCTTRGWRMTVIESLFFGVLSLVYSFLMPTPVATVFTQNPWMPIVPRLLAGLACHGTYVLMRRVCKGDSKAATVVPVIVACAVGSLLNTGLIVPCLVWRAHSLIVPTIGETFISAAIELGVSVTVVPTLAVTVGRALRLPDYVKKAKAVPSPAPQESQEKPTQEE